jgi:hypothetical protein
MPSLDDRTYAILGDLHAAHEVARTQGGKGAGRGVADEVADPLLDGGLITRTVEYRPDDVDLTEPQSVCILTDAGHALYEQERAERQQQEAAARPEAAPYVELEPTREQEA